MTGTAARDFSIEAWSEAVDESAATYWNDASEEYRKSFNTEVPDLDAVYLDSHNAALLDQLSNMVQCDGGAFGQMGASLASGTCWLESRILADHPEIRNLTCVEYSRHRISHHAPRMFNHNQIEPARVRLCFGSFYELKVPTETLDFVMMSQAFHHAFEPEKLLIEINRVLKPGGRVYLIGEHHFGPIDIAGRFLKHWAKLAVGHDDYRRKGGLVPTWRRLFPIDVQKGDHHYTRKMYKTFFQGIGFDYQRIVNTEAAIQGYLLKKSQ